MVNKTIGEIISTANAENIKLDEQSRTTDIQKQKTNNMAFKMKGSPMQRNFGIGAPTKQREPGDQIINGVLCDAYGNPKPNQEAMKDMQKSPDFKNNPKKVDRGLGSAFNQGTEDHPSRGKTEHKDTWVYKGKDKTEKIIDLEDRIFLNSDISEEKSIMKRGKMITQRNKLKNKLKQYRK